MDINSEKWSSKQKKLKNGVKMLGSVMYYGNISNQTLPVKWYVLIISEDKIRLIRVKHNLSNPCKIKINKKYNVK